ncbi:MAG: hypothetical protein ACKOWF_02185 [Chloroflexota bacterium]
MFMLLVALGVVLIAVALLIIAPRQGIGAFFETDRTWAWIIAGIVALIFGGSGLALRPEIGTARRQVRTAGIWTVTVLVGLIALWVLIDHSKRETQWAGQPVASEEQVNAFLAEALPMAGVEGGPPRIKTGVMLQSVEFKSGSNVQVAGYIWMTFPKDLPEEYVRGFVLPDAVTEAYSAKEAYRTTQANGDETIGWYFAATMRRTFDYSRYPFDRPNVYVRVWAQDFSRGGVIVPDFESYIDLKPSTLPGVESQMAYGGWNPVFSGFSYDTAYYNADYGYRSDKTGTGAPEMHFNFVLKRDPINPFTDQLFYGGTVALLIFGLLTLTTANQEDRGRFGVSTAGVLGSVSVLLFGIIAKQTSLRTTLDSQTLTYLESLPIMLYVMLLLTALNAILVAAPFDVPFLEYRNNLLPELLYWPILLTSLFTVTMLVFYR